MLGLRMLGAFKEPLSVGYRRQLSLRRALQNLTAAVERTNPTIKTDTSACCKQRKIASQYLDAGPYQ